MRKFEQTEWVKTIYEEQTVLAKILRSPRFDESVYHIEVFLPTGKTKKIYRSGDRMTLVGLKDVISYHRENGLQY